MGIASIHPSYVLDLELRQRCLLMEKIGRGCTFEDAETLAK